MPYIKDKNLVNIYEEVDKANQTINKLNELLQEEEENSSILKKHRIILGAVALLLLILFLWSYLPKSDARVNQKYLEKNNLTLIDADSLNELRSEANGYLVDRDSTDISDPKSPFAGETIIYSVQIGAFTSFDAGLTSDRLSHLKEFREGGLNKFAIGNFVKYKEALQLKEDLKRLGFKDCFIIAQSYGQPVNIREALQLSDETQYLHQ